MLLHGRQIVKSDWLTTLSFERAFEIVSAISILSIHAKLTQSGVDDPADSALVQKAQAKLLAFLESFQTLLQEAETGQSGIMVGGDPRLNELALHYLAERRRLPPRSRLYTLPLTQLSELIQSEQGENLSDLIEYLESFRSMMELYAQTDIAGMFGDE